MPKSVEISIDEFIDKRSLVAKDGVVYRAAKMPKTFDAETRSATFVMTDETIDSYGDIVRAKGVNLDRFNENPICLLNHRADMILGTWGDVKQISKRVEGTATIAEEGTAPHVDMAYNLMSQGILKGASIGFMPLKVERRLDDDGEPMWSYDILEWEMFECSVVSIPANPAALAKSMKDGNVLARDYLEEVLDTYVKTPSGVIMSIADVEAAYKSAKGNKTSIIVKETDGEMPSEEAIAEFASKLSIESEILVNVDGSGKAVSGEHELDAPGLSNDQYMALFDKISDAVKENASSQEDEIPSAKRDTDGMTIDQINKLAKTGVVFVTEVEINGKNFSGDVVAPSWDAAEKAAGDRDPAETVVGQLVELCAVEDGAKFDRAFVDGLVRFKMVGKDGEEIGGDITAAATKLGKIKTISIDMDTTAVEEKMADLTTKAEGFIAKFGRLFGIKAVEPEPVVEQKAPPTAEEMEAALAKAAAVRERIASKSLIEA